MFVSRNFDRTEEDDFKLNVQPRLHDGYEAMPKFALPTTEDRNANQYALIGWKIQKQYE